MLIVVIVLVIIFYYFLQNNKLHGLSRNESLELLKQRYVNGEIDEETYLRMKKVIEK